MGRSALSRSATENSISNAERPRVVRGQTETTGGKFGDDGQGSSRTITSYIASYGKARESLPVAHFPVSLRISLLSAINASNAAFGSRVYARQ